MSAPRRACPFCGSDNVHVMAEICGLCRWAECDGCGAQGPGGSSEDEAARRWDERAEVEPTPAANPQGGHPPTPAEYLVSTFIEDEPNDD